MFRYVYIIFIINLFIRHVYDIYEDAWSQPAICGFLPPSIYYHQSDIYPTGYDSIRSIITFGGIKPGGDKNQISYSNDIYLFHYLIDENEIKSDRIIVGDYKPDARAYHTFNIFPYSVFNSKCKNPNLMCISFFFFNDVFICVLVFINFFCKDYCLEVIIQCIVMEIFGY